jgi:hypothetical protein
MVVPSYKVVMLPGALVRLGEGSNCEHDYQACIKGSWKDSVDYLTNVVKVRYLAQVQSLCTTSASVISLA